MQIQKPNLASCYKGNLPWLVSNTIFLTLHGSHAYGTNIAGSDVDVKGIAIPPINYYLGISQRFEQAELKGKDPDGVIYEIQKIFGLAKDCNPNVIEVLFTDPSDWIICHPVAQAIIDQRNLFLSKKAYHTFFGYARAQLKRINTHYRWLKNPPSAPVTREEFGLPTRPKLDYDQLSAAMADIKKKIEGWDINWDNMEPSERIEMQDRVSLMLGELGFTMDSRWQGAAKLLGFDDNFIYYLQKEREYNQKCADWDSYEEWKRSRNPARAVLEEKFGYDTKHAMHLVRLIKMCREILSEHKVQVKRPDAEELLAIRAGLLSYDQLLEFTSNQEVELAKLYETSTLPKNSDVARIDKLCEDSIRRFLEI